MIVYCVIGDNTGFDSVYRTINEANDRIQYLDDKITIEDNYVVVKLHTSSDDDIELDGVIETECANLHNITVYIMLSVNDNLPIFVTHSENEFTERQKKYLELDITYPDSAEFWKHNI